MATVQAEMNFLEPWPSKNNEAPYMRHFISAGFPTTNFKNEPHLVEISDARPEMANFSLDRHGFAFFKSNALDSGLVEAIRENRKSEVETSLYPQVSRLVKEKTFAKKVVVFDHGYRKRDPEIDMREGKNAFAKGQPATVVHCDQSEWGATRRVEKHLGPEAPQLLQGRCQIINVWRPLVHAVNDWPLAVMDYSTLSDCHVHPCSLFSRERELQGQTVGINYDENQKWYYLSKQQTDEVTLIKIWDSRQDVARLCAHCAFQHPHSKSTDPPRESVEVRCLVFY